MTAPLSAPSRPTQTRHIVLGMTVAIYMITYMDRTVISSAAPVIQKELGFSLITMGWIFSSFRWGFTLFQMPAAWFGDKIGPRRALALMVTCWSALTSLTSAAWNTASMVVIRFVFGMGEAGAFPVATRSLSRWMLVAERGFAQGITHAGSRLGAAFTPPLVVFLMARYGWRMPFFVLGGLGLLWAAAWLGYYRDTPEEHRGVNPAERELIHKGTGGPLLRAGAKVPWRQILSSRTLWSLSLMYFCYQYALAVYLDWFPTYLKVFRGFTLKEMGFYASLPLLAGTLGDLAGGWFSDTQSFSSATCSPKSLAKSCTGFAVANEEESRPRQVRQ